MIDIPQVFQQKNTKKQWKVIALSILENDQIEILLEYFLQTQHYRQAQQAAGVFMTLVDVDKNVLYPYQSLLVEHLSSQEITPTQQRNIFRFFQYVYIREEVEGELLDASFKTLENPNLPIAVRVFSMTVAARIAKRYPEIIPELDQLITLNLEMGNSAGFQNRAQKIRKKWIEENRNIT